MKIIAETVVSQRFVARSNFFVTKQESATQSVIILVLTVSENYEKNKNS
jgi:hypothetical protein